MKTKVMTFLLPLAYLENVVVSLHLIEINIFRLSRWNSFLFLLGLASLGLGLVNLLKSACCLRTSLKND